MRKLLGKKSVWMNTEFYFYGKITDIGGKTDPNIHIDTKEYGSLTISTPENKLRNIRENILYKQYGIHALGKQDINTFNIDKNSLKFIELIRYYEEYKEDYINNILKVKSKWDDIDNIEQYIREIRGEDE